MSRTKSNQCVVERGVEWPSGTSTPSIPVPAVHAFRTEYVETARLDTLLKTSPSHVLGIVRHDRNHEEARGADACPIVYLDLPQLNGPPLAEVWTSTQPVTYHQAEDIHCAMNDEVLFGALHVEERPGAQLNTMTYDAYRHLLVQVRALGYPHLLRMWNYFPHINRVSNGLERYQQFCAGRYQALAEGLSGFPRTLPAATAVGTLSGPLNIHFLAARLPGTHVENPRQVRAYEYPSVYGPRSPSFARATLRPSLYGANLLISGTASVVGHISVHIGEPQKQTLEILHNLTTLITHAEQLHGADRRWGNGHALLKVYIRHPEHVPAVRTILQERMPSQSRVLYLQGEMCRRELLLEIEGILGQESSIDINRTVSQLPGRLQQSMVSQHEPDRLKRA